MFLFIMGLLFVVLCIIGVSVLGAFAFRLWTDTYYEYKRQKEKYNSQKNNIKKLMVLDCEP